MLTLASRLTNTHWHIKHKKKHSTQQLLPSNCVWCWVWGVCEDEWVWMDGNVLVYLLNIWVRVNMLCVLLCFKHSSCLSPSTKLNNKKAQRSTTRTSIRNKSVKILKNKLRKNYFLRRLFIHSVIKIHKLAGLWVSFITSRSTHETTPNKTENIIIES